MEKYDYIETAKKIIKGVIKKNDKYDINELLYNSEEVADEIQNMIIEEGIDDDKTPDNIARDYVCDNMDLAETATSEACMNYEEICQMFFCNEWNALHNIIIHYFATDYDIILSAIKELTNE